MLGGFPTRAFWKPLKQWAQFQRNSRLTAREWEGYESLHNGFRLDLLSQGSDKSRTFAIGYLTDRRELNDLPAEDLQKVILNRRELMLSPCRDCDTSFALDIKGMILKDACATCFAHSFYGSNPLHQVGGSVAFS